jgi:hypothetical protein
MILSRFYQYDQLIDLSVVGQHSAKMVHVYSGREQVKQCKKLYINRAELDIQDSYL